MLFREDTVWKPLQAPYAGPFRVIRYNNLFSWRKWQAGLDLNRQSQNCYDAAQ